ncbi:MAG: hypothetical protein OXU88_01720 [Gammaproteobacteria bacterium]|nr:hypothetical protein [Gammaproteobacteria bacterium]
MSKFTLNEADQRERERRVDEYLKKERLFDVRHFGCRHLGDCKSSCAQGIDFTEGQLHHIGAHYSLLRDDEPFRIVVVGEQYGGEQPTGLDERREVIRDCHRFKPNSGGKKSDKSDKNNPHMTGTLLALRFLFEKPFPLPFAAEDSNLDVGGNAVSIFDCFALTNYLLCSANAPGKKSTEATDAMWENCREHIATVLRILQPTHLVLQGASLASYLAPVTGPLQKDECTTVSAFGVETHVFYFNHPSAPSKSTGWGMVSEASDSEDSYLRRVVEPVIKSAVK